MLPNLPEDVFLHILEFLSHQIQVECTLCQKQIYKCFYKNYVRKILIVSLNVTNIEKQFSELKCNSYQQVSLRLDPKASNNVRIIQAFRDGINFLQCSGTELAQFTLSDLPQSYRVKRVEILYFSDIAIYTQVYQLLSLMIFDLQQLSIDLRNIDAPLPYIKSLLVVEIKNSSHVSPIPRSYDLQLTRLKVEFCNLSDVSGFGQIADLELRHCDNITDISSLNYNRRVQIEFCGQVTDFTNAFQNTTIILLSFFHRGSGRIDMTHWRQVKTLVLELRGARNAIELINGNNLPKQIIRCHLIGAFTELVNYRLTPDHSLRELTLEEAHNMQSFQGYGLENLVVLRVQSSQSLSSLEGLGCGRNQRIILEMCDKVTDFSPLHSVPSVEVLYCKGFTSQNLTDLKNVKHLRISTVNELDFAFQLNEYITESVDLSCAPNIVSLEGLERVPYLRLNKIHLNNLSEFLQGGFKLQNHRIDFLLPDELSPDLLTAIDHPSLQSEYQIKSMPLENNRHRQYTLVLLRKH